MPLVPRCAPRANSIPQRWLVRDFSATEHCVIARLVAVITEEYKKAWTGIYPIELEYQRSEMQPQFANVATPSEIVISTSFQLEIGEIHVARLG